MRSGIPNFCAVALALNDLGYVLRLLLVIAYLFNKNVSVNANKVPKVFFHLNFLLSSALEGWSNAQIEVGL